MANIRLGLYAMRVRRMYHTLCWLGGRGGASFVCFLAMAYDSRFHAVNLLKELVGFEESPQVSVLGNITIQGGLHVFCLIFIKMGHVQKF